MKLMWPIGFPYACRLSSERQGSRALSGLHAVAETWSVLYASYVFTGFVDQLQVGALGADGSRGCRGWDSTDKARGSVWRWPAS